LQTLAAHKEDAYQFIKRFHDHRFPNDRMNLVYRATIIEKQENDLGSFESWIIGTESGARFDYTIQIAVYWQGQKKGTVYGKIGYAIIKVSKLSEIS